MKGAAVRKLMATTVAGLSLAFIAVGPVQASPCEASAQTVTRAAGAWSSLSGPIVTAAVEESGVSWAVGSGSVLDHVMLEYAPVEADGTIVSAAVTLPGAPSGLMPIAGDGDVTIRFVGSMCAEHRSGDAVEDDLVVDVSGVAQDQSPEPEAATAGTVRPAADASVTTPAPASQPRAAVVDVRHMCRFVTFAA
jgi:hypothetical protein